MIHIAKFSNGVLQIFSAEHTFWSEGHFCDGGAY